MEQTCWWESEGEAETAALKKSCCQSLTVVHSQSLTAVHSQWLTWCQSCCSLTSEVKHLFLLADNFTPVCPHWRGFTPPLTHPEVFLTCRPPQEGAFTTGVNCSKHRIGLKVWRAARKLCQWWTWLLLEVKHRSIVSVTLIRVTVRPMVTTLSTWSETTPPPLHDYSTSERLTRPMYDWLPHDQLEHQRTSVHRNRRSHVWPIIWSDLLTVRLTNAAQLWHHHWRQLRLPTTMNGRSSHSQCVI